MITEELDVDLDQVRIDPGVPSPIHCNTKVAAEGIPVKAFDEGMLGNTMRGAGDPVAKLMEMQITGCSTTVPDGFDKLRAAGAVARQTLKRAAAQQTGADINALRTERGAVVLPDGTKIPYTVLARAVSQIDPVTDIALRHPSGWRFLGQE